MKKYFSLLLLVLFVSIESSEMKMRDRSNSLLSTLLRKVRASGGVEKTASRSQRRYSHGQELTPNSRYKTLRGIVESFDAERHVVEEPIISLDICPQGIQAMAHPITSAYYYMLQKVGNTYLKTSDVAQKESRVTVVNVRKALDKIDTHLRMRNHLELAHFQQYGKPYESFFNRVLESDLERFNQAMDLKLQKTQQKMVAAAVVTREKSGDRLLRLRSRTSTAV